MVDGSILGRRISETLSGQRDAILSAICFAATRFLVSDDWDRDIDAILEALGNAAEVSRVYLFEAWREDDGILYAGLRHEWTAASARPRISDPGVDKIPLDSVGLGRWERLGHGETIFGNVSAFAPRERAFFEPLGIRSVAIMPVVAGDEWWGYLGMADDVAERDWPADVRDALQVAAATLGAAIYRKRSDQKLRDSEQRYQRLSEAAVEGILIHDHGIVLEANTALTHMFGYSREEIVGHSAYDWAPMPVSLRMLPGHYPFNFDVRYEAEGTRKDGSRIFVEILGGPTTYKGRPARVVTMHDITMRKDAEDARQMLEAEHRARAAAEAAAQARDEVLGIVAHDLRNPLGTVLMASESLAEVMPPEMSKYSSQLGVIRRSAERMNRLIQDLLDVKRIEGGAMHLSPEVTDTDALLDDANDLLCPLAATAKINVDVVHKDGLPPVMADRQRIQQVFSNLGGNALKFTPPGGNVRVSAEPVGHEVQFSVQDSGPGISPEHVSTIFDRMWQANRLDTRGIGLGLTIAKGIVDRHGGRIWVESAVGHGTTFYFTLPTAN